MTTQKRQGIYKGVSEPVYPDDILSDQELQGAPPETRGIWCANILPVMWRDKNHTLTAPLAAFARRWGVDTETAQQIIDDIKTHKIGDVSQECPQVVSITCRRLKRAAIHREMERLKKAKQRCPDDVPHKKALPPYPSPYPSPSPVPVDVEVKEDISSDKLALVTEAWNRLAAQTALPATRGKPSKTRTAALKQRLNDKQWVADYKAAIEKIPSCPFLLGDSDGGWRADFDWFIKPESVNKIMEGQYNGKPRRKAGDARGSTGIKPIPGKYDGIEVAIDNTANYERLQAKRAAECAAKELANS